MKNPGLKKLIFPFGKRASVREPLLCGFTLIELMVTFSIIGIVVAFAIPNYRRSVAREQERTAVLNLRAVLNAQRIYRAQMNQYWPLVSGANQDVEAINAGLNVSIIPEGLTYTCRRDNAAAPFAYSCRAQAGTNYTIGLNVISGAISCSGGACPCPTSPGEC